MASSVWIILTRSRPTPSGAQRPSPSPQTPRPPTVEPRLAPPNRAPTGGGLALACLTAPPPPPYLTPTLLPWATREKERQRRCLPLPRSAPRHLAHGAAADPFLGRLHAHTLGLRVVVEAHAHTRPSTDPRPWRRLRRRLRPAPATEAIVNVLAGSFHYEKASCNQFGVDAAAEASTTTPPVDEWWIRCIGGGGSGCDGLDVTVTVAAVVSSMHQRQRRHIGQQDALAVCCCVDALQSEQENLVIMV
ncbi:hypothetical protein ABZP36_007542 [Zizania latifolia]